MTLQEKIYTSIECIRQYEPEEGYYLGFSGGKDSQALLRLTQMAGVKYEVHYNYTRIDPPELVRFIKKEYPEVIFDIPNISYWDLIRKNKFPPSSLNRYCCRILKEGNGVDKVKLLGVRAEESSRRKKQQHVSYNRILPIFNWTEMDVWEFISDLPHCVLYDEGYDRIGCIGCPLKSKRLRQRDFERWPAYEKCYRKVFDDVVKIRKTEGKKCTWNNGDELFDWYMGR